MDDFKSPSSRYRPIAFWSWNDKLEAAELVRQIREMDEQGWGGFFMHARAGLETPYLSEEWFDCVKTCVNEAKSRGMQAWIYDEDTWPSGWAGGLIPRLGEEYREKHLFLAENEIPHHPDDIRMLKIYKANRRYAAEAAYYRDRSSAYRLENIAEITQKEAAREHADEVILYFYQWTAPLTNPRYRGASYVDLLNPKVAEAFIASTHERYKRAIGAEFGATVPGSFTDDLTVLWNIWGRKKQALPWTTSIPERFIARYGYDLLDCLPQLYFPLEGCERVRIHFHDLVNDLFVESYTKILHEWCEQNGLKSTGHLMGGDPILSYMRHFEYMQVPGIDHLALGSDQLLGLRQLDSAVCQFRKEGGLCETFGAAGQNLTMEDQKWVCNWLFLNSVTVLTPHLSSYSLRGSRKRDHPPNLFYQQPWWGDNRLMADYQARVSYALSQGVRVKDVLVLHVQDSAFAAHTPLRPEAGGLAAKKLEKVLRRLLEARYDFDLGDESILARHGSVEGAELAVGHGRYRCVVIPPVLTIRASTLTLLDAFMKGGGVVIYLGEPPAMVDGLPGGGLAYEALLQGALPAGLHHLEALLRSKLPPRIRIEETNGGAAASIYCHQRRVDSGYVYFIINHGRTNAAELLIRIPEIGRLRVMNAENGEMEEAVVELEGAADHREVARGHGEDVFDHLENASDYCEDASDYREEASDYREEASDYREDASDYREDASDYREVVASVVREDGSPVRPGSGLTYRTTLAPSGSLILLLDTEEAPSTGGGIRRQSHAERAVPIADWELRPLEPNMLLLDHCSVRLPGQQEDGVPLIHWKAEQSIREANAAAYTVTYAFRIASWDGRQAELILESPERYTIAVNGTVVDAKPEGWWKDISFKRIPLPQGCLRQGDNTISISGTNADAPSIEAAYLIGDFGVELQDRRIGVLNRREDRCAGADLTLEGYPLYAGSVVLSAEVPLALKPDARYVLTMDAMEAITAHLSVNGADAGAMLWRPYEIDVTDLLREGRNRISLRIASSLHNLLGPHHHWEGEIKGPMVHFGSFTDEANWSRTYALCPFGVQGVRLVEWQENVKRNGD